MHRPYTSDSKQWSCCLYSTAMPTKGRWYAIVAHTQEEVNSSWFKVLDCCVISLSWWILVHYRSFLFIHLLLKEQYSLLLCQLQLGILLLLLQSTELNNHLWCKQPVFNFYGYFTNYFDPDLNQCLDPCVCFCNHQWGEGRPKNCPNRGFWQWLWLNDAWPTSPWLTNIITNVLVAWTCHSKHALLQMTIQISLQGCTAHSFDDK